MKILAIVGSPRLKGNINYLVDEALGEAAKLGVQTEKLVLSQYKVSPCLGCDDCASRDSCRLKDDAEWILDRFCEADGIIMATPVYYYNVSAQMKAFIDRNYFLYKHGQKYETRTVGVIVVAATEGIEDTVHTLKQFIDELDAGGDRIFIACGYADRLGEAKDNTSLVEEVRKLGRQMAGNLKEGN